MVTKRKLFLKGFFIGLFLTLSLLFFIFSAKSFIFAQTSPVNLPNSNIVASNINAWETAEKIIDKFLGFLGLIAVVIIIYAGFLWLTAGGDTKKVDKAKRVLKEAIIGLLIIFAAWGIAQAVFALFGPSEDRGGRGSSGGGGGYHYTLPGGTLFTLKRINYSSPTHSRDNLYRCSKIQAVFNHRLKEPIYYLLEEGSDPILAVRKRSDDSIFGGRENWKSFGRVISFEPPASSSPPHTFPADTEYKAIYPKRISDASPTPATLQLCSAEGCSSADTFFAWNFKTGSETDDTPPEIISTYPSNDPTRPDRNVNLTPVIVVHFSEPIDAETVIDSHLSGGSFPNWDHIKIEECGIGRDLPTSCTRSPGVPPFSANEWEVEILSNGFRLHFLPSTERSSLSDSHWYKITVQGIKDLCGNEMESPQEWYFQTKGRAPGVESYYPEGDRVCPDTPISLTFNTPMYFNQVSFKITTGSTTPYLVSLRASDLSPGPYEINLSDGTTFKIIDISDSVDNKFRVFELKPGRDLTVGATYHVEVTTDLIVSEDGELLSHSWSFTIASASDCYCSPHISYLDPSQGPPGSCLIVHGYCFRGSDRRLTPVLEFDGTLAEIRHIDERGTYIGTTLPSRFSEDDRPKAKVKITYPSSPPLESNEVEFYVNSSTPARGPCIWSLNPPAARVGEEIEITGDRLEPTDDDLDNDYVNFPLNIHSDFSGSDVSVSTTVPSGTESGDLYLVVDGQRSNSLFFTLLEEGSSGEGPGESPGEGPGEGSGSEEPEPGTEGGECLDDCSRCGEGLVCAPRDCRCYSSEEAEIHISAETPSECTNGQIILTFDKLMEHSSLTLDNIKLKKIEGTTEEELGIEMGIIDNDSDGDGRVDETKVIVTPSDLLEAGANYSIKVLTTPPPATFLGFELDSPFSQNFTLSESAEICQLDHLDIIPSYWYSTEKDELQNFRGILRDINNHAISPRGYHLLWSKSDPYHLISLSSTEGSEIVVSHPDNRNGQAQIQLSASPELPGYTGSPVETARIEIFICRRPGFINLNPLGQPFFEDNHFNFKLRYCRDYGDELATDDDLPELKLERPSGGHPEIIGDYLFSAEGARGTIGLRVLKDDEHYLPDLWFALKFGRLPAKTNLKIGGYPAVQEGRTVYVEASNIICQGSSRGGSPGLGGELNNNQKKSLFARLYNYFKKIIYRLFAPKLAQAISCPGELSTHGTCSGSGCSLSIYTNIYLLSYSDDADEKIINIYNQLLNNWEFNSNLGGSPDKKFNLAKDTRRLGDLEKIAYLLEEYKSKNGHYPLLESAIYLPGQSTSLWPSWQDTLAKELGEELPVDPDNKLFFSYSDDTCHLDTDCLSEDYPQCYNYRCISLERGFSPETGWNKALLKFKCPMNSSFYLYRVEENGKSYSLFSRMEYSNIGWSPSKHMYNYFEPPCDSGDSSTCPLNFALNPSGGRIVNCHPSSSSYVCDGICPANCTFTQDPDCGCNSISLDGLCCWRAGCNKFNDLDCRYNPPEELEGEEITCNDGRDNDGDGLVDCLDPDCDGKKCRNDCLVCAGGSCSLPNPYLCPSGGLATCSLEGFCSGPETSPEECSLPGSYDYNLLTEEYRICHSDNHWGGWRTCASDCAALSDEWLTFAGHQYKILNEKVDWQTAKEHCQAAGGYLAKINNIEEDIFINENFNCSGGIWLAYWEEKLGIWYTWFRDGGREEYLTVACYAYPPKSCSEGGECSSGRCLDTYGYCSEEENTCTSDENCLSGHHCQDITHSLSQSYCACESDANCLDRNFPYCLGGFCRGINSCWGNVGGEYTHWDLSGEPTIDLKTKCAVFHKDNCQPGWMSDDCNHTYYPLCEK